MLRHCLTALPLLLASAATVAFAPPWRAYAGDQRISGPYTYDNLTIFLVHGASSQGPVPLTLEEALERGNVKVHETGTVSELEIENVGNEDVFVHAGDIVKGGQQDRVLTVTILVPPKSGRMPISSYCVERGRWSARGDEEVAKFTSSKAFMPSLEGKRAMRIAQKEVVTAAAPKVPQALVDQLKPGGRMVIPVGGDGDIQFLKLLTRRADGGVDEKRVLPVRFVPLVPGKK